MKPNQSAFDVGQLAKDMADGYCAHSAAMTVVGRLDEQTLRRVAWLKDPTGSAPCKDGNEWLFNLRDFLQLTTTRPAIADELPLVWLAGSMIRLGDALERNGYFDRAPVLELVRHLRNGIAHGNRFNILDPDKLKKFPAHNRDVWPKRPNNPATFEIKHGLDGQRVLFDFMKAGDVLELLGYVSLHLKRIGNGQPLQPPTNVILHWPPSEKI
jgi:hypothetical protein